MVMNERVMQFRIGMFVIVAGLVLTMLIVWFGESPSLFRDHVYLTVRYAEAPGVAEGIPVRKSGIRVGEVTGIHFDERPNQPDGVLVTLSLERKYKIKAGSVPRINKSLIGDAAIDMMPGVGPGNLKTGETPETAPVIEGEVAADPSKALAAATLAFEKVGGTLASIDAAAGGIAKITKSAEGIGEFLDTWSKTGNRLTAAADDIDRFIRANEGDVRPAVTNLKEITGKVNRTLDEPTQAALRDGIKKFSAAAGQLAASLEEAAPLFRDLGAPITATPSTDFGNTVRRVDLIAGDVALLTRAFRGQNNTLNTEGSLQRFVTRPEVFENISRMAASGAAAFEGIRPILASFRKFADQISRDPGAISRGAFRN